jgi:hypothetical protein
MTLAVPGATGFVALAQRAVVAVVSGSCHRPGSRTMTGRIETEFGVRTRIVQWTAPIDRAS